MTRPSTIRIANITTSTAAKAPPAINASERYKAAIPSVVDRLLENTAITSPSLSLISAVWQAAQTSFRAATVPP